jgi:hypothetical protein
MVDVSASVADGARKEAIARMANELTFVTEVFDCALLRFTAFSGEPPFNALREPPPLPVVLPLRSCDAAQSAAAGRSIGTAVEVVYPKIGRAHQEAAEAKCLADDRLRYDRELLDRRQAVEAARPIWFEVARTPARGACTALDFAVQRAVGRSQHVLVLSDGSNSCPTPRADPTVQMAVDQSLTFLLLASAGPTAAERGVRAAARLETRYPASRVLFFSELTPSLWRTLASPK